MPGPSAELTDVRTIQITGGRVIDPSQDIDRVTDVCLGRGRVLADRRGVRGGRRRHRRPGDDRLPRPDRRPRPPPRAGQRGGRDHRHRRPGRPGRGLHLGRLHAQHPAGDRQPGGGRVRRPPGPAGAVRQRLPGRGRQQGAQGGGAGRAGPARRRRGGGLHRRRGPGRLGLPDAAGLAVRQDVRPLHHAALPGDGADRRRRDERGVRVDEARPGRDARGGRGHHGRPRHPPGRDHRRPAPHPAHLDRAGRRAGPRGEAARGRRHGRGLPAPLHPDRRAAPDVRLQLQDEPARCGPRPTSTP